MAAVHIANYDMCPVIGRVIEIGDEMIKLHYWKGTYNGKGVPQNIPRTQTPWIDDLPNTCIIMCMFELTDGSKLLPSTKRHLKQAYQNIKDGQQAQGENNEEQLTGEEGGAQS